MGAKAAAWLGEIRLLSLSIAAAACLYATVTVLGVFPAVTATANAAPTGQRLARFPVVQHRVRTIVIPSLVQLSGK